MSLEQEILALGFDVLELPRAPFDDGFALEVRLSYCPEIRERFCIPRHALVGAPDPEEFARETLAPLVERLRGRGNFALRGVAL